MVELNKLAQMGELFTKLATIATPLSIFFGLGLFIGRAFGVGFWTFQLVGFEDVIVSSLLAAPLVFCGVFILLLSRLATSGSVTLPPQAEIEFFHSWWFITLVLAFLLISLITQTAALWSVSLNLGGILLLYALQGRINHKVSGRPYEHEARYFTVVICTFFFLAIYGFRETTEGIYSDKFPSQVCTTDCRAANLVLRLSNVTIVRFKGEDDGAILSNEEIKQIKQPFGRVSAAAFDLGATLAWFFTTPDKSLEKVPPIADGPAGPAAPSEQVPAAQKR